MDAQAIHGGVDLLCSSGPSMSESEAPVALVVSYDDAKRNQLEAWLEVGGLTVAGCPGPGVPVICPQMHGLVCPLATEANVVVLDLVTMGSFTLASAPGWVLLDTYLERGARVVVLADHDQDPPVLQDVPYRVLPRNVPQRRLLETIRTVLGAA
jgi:hypothetical protein